MSLSRVKGKRSLSQQMSQAISPLMESLENRQMLSAGLIQRFVDTDGDLVKVRIINGGTVDTIDPVTRNIELSGTGINSLLNITVQRAAGGDGLVTLGEIRCDGPMLAINGPSADITHEISINDLNQPVSPANKVSINLGALVGVAMYTGTLIGQRISTLQLADWSRQAAGQELNAPSIDTFIITGRADVPGTPANESLPGNSGEAMFIGDSSTDANTFSVGTMSIAGSLGDVQATGRLGSITAWTIYGQLSASTYGTIKAVRATGEILATGTPGVPEAISSINITGKVTTLRIATNQDAIGQISIGARALNLTVVSAKGLSSLTVGQSLDGSRIQTHNMVGFIQVGGMSDTAIQVGVARDFTGIATSAADFAKPGATLQNFVVTGIIGQAPTTSWVTGTNVLSLPRVGTMKLRNVDSPESLQIFVLDAGSPTLVRYMDSPNPSANFLWQPGNPLPSMLTVMLHHV